MVPETSPFFQTAPVPNGRRCAGNPVTIPRRPSGTVGKGVVLGHLGGWFRWLVPSLKRSHWGLYPWKNRPFWKERVQHQHFSGAQGVVHPPTLEQRHQQMMGFWDRPFSRKSVLNSWGRNVNKTTTLLGKLGVISMENRPWIQNLYCISYWNRVDFPVSQAPILNLQECSCSLIFQHFRKTNMCFLHCLEEQEINDCKLVVNKKSCISTYNLWKKGILKRKCPSSSHWFSEAFALSFQGGIFL